MLCRRSFGPINLEGFIRKLVVPAPEKLSIKEVFIFLDEMRSEDQQEVGDSIFRILQPVKRKQKFQSDSFADESVSNVWTTKFNCRC